MKDHWTTFDSLQWLAVVLCILAFVLLCHCEAETLPDAPGAVAQPQERASSTWHQLRLPLTVMWASNAADIGLTCRVLGNGGHEDFLPTQSCVGVVAILAGERAAATGVAWILARKGHPKLAKSLLWAMTGSTGYAIGYTVGHWNDPKRVPLPPSSPIIVQGGTK